MSDYLQLDMLAMGIMNASVVYHYSYSDNAFVLISNGRDPVINLVNLGEYDEGDLERNNSG